MLTGNNLMNMLIDELNDLGLPNMAATLDISRYLLQLSLDTYDNEGSQTFGQRYPHLYSKHTQYTNHFVSEDQPPGPNQ